MVLVVFGGDFGAFGGFGGGDFSYGRFTILTNTLVTFSCYFWGLTKTSVNLSQNCVNLTRFVLIY